MKRDGFFIDEESDVFARVSDTYGFAVAGCLRADIIDLLLKELNKKKKGDDDDDDDRVQVKYSHKLTRITPIRDKVEVEFANGEQGLFDIVIGLDGINSEVAKQLNIGDDSKNEQSPIYSKANIFYGKIPQPNKLSYFRDHPILRDGTVVNTPGLGQVMFFYAGSGANKTFIWACTYPSTEPPSEEEWQSNSRRRRSSSNNINKSDDDDGDDDDVDDDIKWQQLQQRILSKMPPDHILHDCVNFTRQEDLLHFGLYFRQHKKTWTDDSNRVVLLGDSCHATLPYVGQGANQAIEDAVYLADCLREYDDHIQAFDRYYQKRFPRTKRIVQMAERLHHMYHTENFLLKGLINFALVRMMKGDTLYRQFENKILKECPVKDYEKYVMLAKEGEEK